MTIERITITDREQWLKLREPDMTASAAPALLGAHPYMTLYGLWALKMKLTADTALTPPMIRGTELEPLARKWIARERPTWRVTAVHQYYRDPEKRLGCTPDCFAYDPARGKGAIQIKNPEPSAFRKWKNEEGVIEPPLYATIQAIIEARLTGAKWAAVAALVVGHGIDIYILDIPLHEGIMQRVEEETAAFWRAVALGKPPEPDFERDGETIASLYRQAEPGKTLDLRGDNEIRDLLTERAKISAQNTANKKRGDSIRAELLHKIGNAERILVPGGYVTAPTIARKGYTVEPTSYRDIRFKEDQT